jgi:hypothetical protein
MATVQRVITAALRKVTKVTEGQPAPVAWDAKNALEVMNSLYAETFSRGLFGRLTAVLIEDDYEANENERITNVSDDDVTVTLPATITDDGEEERMPRDLAVVVVTDDDDDAEPALYIYEANRGSWVSAFDLALTSYAPLSSRGIHGLACWIAARMADEYGYQVGPATVLEAGRFHGALAIRFDSERVTTTASYF